MQQALGNKAILSQAANSNAMYLQQKSHDLNGQELCHLHRSLLPMQLAHPSGLAPSIGKRSLRHQAQRIAAMAQASPAAARTWESMADAKLGEEHQLFPPFQPLAACEKGSFAEGTV
jgi:hypothetical protein